jgi:hypothetical protein
MKLKKLNFTAVLLLLFTIHSQAQLGFSHEIGVITGPVVFYSDFGQRNDMETNMGNVGYGIGIVHYMNFAYRADCNCYTRDNYFNDHFKVRSELSYHKTNFEHYGEWVDPSRTSTFADFLRAMKGSSSVVELGAQLEYFPLSIRDYMANRYKIVPFVSFGFHWVNFKPEIYFDPPLSTIITNPADYPDKYRDTAFLNQSDSSWAVLWSVGVRYKLSYSSDLMLDSRWVHYFSNWVDGLNPEVPENKANDWIYWLNIGYIYYIN